MEHIKKVDSDWIGVDIVNEHFDYLNDIIGKKQIQSIIYSLINEEDISNLTEETRGEDFNISFDINVLVSICTVVTTSIELYKTIFKKESTESIILKIFENISKSKSNSILKDEEIRKIIVKVLEKINEIWFR